MRVFRSTLMRTLRHRWPRLKRVLPALVLIVVAGLLIHFGRAVDWPQVWISMRAIPASTIALAAGLVVAGYLAYGAMDLLGKRYARHTLPWPKVLGVAMTSYALNLNLGVLLGGLGARLRLYARLGCRKSVATRVALFSAASNWIGYGWLAGALFASGAVPVPESWGVGSGVLRLAGAALLGLAAAYLAFCALARRRTWTWMGQHAALPSARMAIAQSAVAATSWALMGAIVYVLLQGKASYPTVLGVLLCTSFAAVVIRVPGGLGTTEAIFVAALAPQIPAPEVLGAALVYRALYAFAPLCLALSAFLLVEFRLRHTRRPARARAAPVKPDDPENRNNASFRALD
ncbi:lysylphosphatidylglycerol synthase domain-containing protein [Achromobacter agilis]|uniref:Inner membrane protein YbhN n=1 Tax=Achromobacter agilis TaxID=1353888 RepID=A0A446CG99_9BURK|nr:lysylphosphatidylglycerol synthase domain-containing protein [Achromobacter agilis]SSW66872.1 Inner membrane protein YbhN [Achromobacter agilis]